MKAVIIAYLALFLRFSLTFHVHSGRMVLRRPSLASLASSTRSSQDGKVDGMDLNLEQMQDIFDAADVAADGETLEEVPVRNAEGGVETSKGGGFDKLDIGLRLQDLLTVILTVVIAKNTFEIVRDLLPK